MTFILYGIVTGLVTISLCDDLYSLRLPSVRADRRRAFTALLCRRSTGLVGCVRAPSTCRLGLVTFHVTFSMNQFKPRCRSTPHAKPDVKPPANPPVSLFPQLKEGKKKKERERKESGSDSLCRAWTRDGSQ